ncbi:MAG: ribulose-phosphate 3-epimerase [Candidatus Cryptobacteroides sp.]|nr:ribulose-phosphate 3-epimerase [Candidatus Cryptobacteroides sp.]
MIQIAPSMLSADFLHLEKDIEMVNSCADIFHLDVMDGSFVPNISYGFPVTDAIAKAAKKPLDVHLMIVDPEKYALKFVKNGASMVSFHLEATENDEKASRILKSIQQAGAKAGLVINPDIPVERLFPHVGNADFFLIMSVFAGFGGQKFIPQTYEKISRLKSYMQERGVDTPIEVDGGVSLENINALHKAGAEIFVAGSAIFKSESPVNYVAQMRQACID